jgi:hypothetical protein
MTDATNTINENSVSEGDQVKALTGIVERLEQNLIAFSGTVIQALTGHPQGATTTTPARRRGRPPKAISAPPVVEVKPRAPHQMELAIADVLKRSGRMTQTELAHSLKKERSLVVHHIEKEGGLLERGEVIMRYVKKAGEHRHIVYYHPTWVSFRGE